MKNWMKEENIHLQPHRKLQFGLLLVICVAEVLFMITEGMFRYVGYYLIETYIAIPCVLFLGILLLQKLPAAARGNLCLSGIAMLWFVLAQVRHRTLGMSAFPEGFFILSYLLAFPFASVTEDQKHSMGIKIVSSLFLVASLVLVGYSALLVLDWQPGYMKAFIYWDGTRLRPLWHPNITACILMIGIGIALSYLFHTGKTWKRVLLIFAAAVQFLTISLTNSRTSLLLTSALIGFAVFLALHRGGRKGLLPGIAAALLVTAALFTTAGSVYELNERIQEAKVLEQMQEEARETEPAEETAEQTRVPQESQASQASQVPEDPRTADAAKREIRVNEATGDITIRGSSKQGTLKNDLKTLNGRTIIWGAALESAKSDRTLMWWGTKDVDEILSARLDGYLEHSHNSWMEMLLSLGIPGLLVSLVYTAIALWSAAVLLVKGAVERWKKMISVLVLCVLAASFLEPFLFITKSYYHFIDFIFFFFLGYLDLWRRQALHPEAFRE